MPKPSEVQKVIESNRRRINRRDLEWQKQIAQSYANAMSKITLELDMLVEDIERARAAGVQTSPSWLARQERYLSLQSRLHQAISQFGTEIADGTPHRLMSSLEDGLKLSRAEILAGMQGPGYGPETWAVVNARAITAGMAMFNHESSPLRKLLLQDIPETAYAALRNEFTNGLLLGRNPNKIAKKMVTNVGHLALGRAQLIARTEFHRAFRQAKVEQYKDLDVVDGWIWSAALDGRTCAVCYAMHGTFFPKTQTLAGHPACRCVMVPHTKDWKSLGFDGMKDTRPVIEPGYKKFSRLPADQQLRILGPTRFKMYQSGVPLSSMIRRIDNATWGRMYALEPVRLTSATVKKVTGGSGTPHGGQFGLDDYKNPFNLVQNLQKDLMDYLGKKRAAQDWGAAWGHLVDFAQDLRSAIRVYQGTSYRDINRYLRQFKGDMAAAEEWFRSAYGDAITRLDQAMNLSRLDQAAVLYRGTGYSAFGGPDTIKSKVGQTLTEHGFLSAATHNPFSGDVLMVIHAPKGTKAVWMSQRNTDPYVDQPHPKDSAFAKENGENEVLLARGTKYRVDKVEEFSHHDTGRYRFRVDVTVVGQK